MATHSNGISALAQVGWLICASLRHSLVVPNSNPLAGLVEGDETEVACRSKHVPVPSWWTLSPGQDHRRRRRRGQGWRSRTIRLAEVAAFERTNQNRTVEDPCAFAITATQGQARSGSHPLGHVVLAKTC
jgi:hypothetical protein